jgi:hypothetical protein
MHWKAPAALAAGLVLLATLALPADAATRKRVVVARAAPSQATVFVSRDESGRRRTRIIVQRRSYLDAGTEVLPGQRKFTDYAIPPYYSAYDVLGPGRNFDRQPLNPRWEDSGRRAW